MDALTMSSPELEFGLLLHTRHLIRKGENLSQVAELWETASFAEKIGFDQLWLGDSPRLSLLDRAHADCLTLMAALAAKTSTIKIGTVPIIIAVGVGHQYPYAEREFAACGVPYHERAGRLNESIQLIRRLWTESAFAYAGKYFQFEELGVEPKPIQSPIPMWIAAGDNENALRRVARLGDGWFTVAHTAEQFVARRKKIDLFARASGRESKN